MKKTVKKINPPSARFSLRRSEKKESTSASPRSFNLFARAVTALFITLFTFSCFASADEIKTLQSIRYEGIIINQSPSEVTIKLKDKTLRLNRSDLKRVKKWDKEKNDALLASWKDPSAGLDLSAKDAELKFAESVNYSTMPWQIYEEEVFIAFHHQEGIIKSRFKGKVGGYCRKVAERFQYKEFKLFNDSPSSDWSLKFKFYSYRDFNSWRKISESKSFNPATLQAFTEDDRRVFFYELYMKEDNIYHEIAHDIYMEFTNDAVVPKWWSEGVVEYALLSSNDARRLISRSKFRAMNNKHISLTGKNYTKEHLYEDGISVVYFLAEGKNKDKFEKFNYKLRSGKGFSESLSETYGFKDISELEGAWLEYLKNLQVKDISGV